MTWQGTLEAMRRHWWIVMASVCLGAAVLFALSAMVRPTYTASARVFVSIASSRGASDLSQGATFIQSQVASYADLAASPYVLEPVAKRLNVSGGVEELARAVTATSSKETVLIDVTATDLDAGRAATIAEAVADELGVALSRLAPKDTDGRPIVQVITVAKSGPPAEPASPRTRRNMLFGAVAGGLLAVVGLAVFSVLRPESPTGGSAEGAEAPGQRFLRGASGLRSRSTNVR